MKVNFSTYILHDQSNEPVKSKLQISPPSPLATPRAFEFLENFGSNLPSLGRTAFQMLQPPGKYPDFCFNFSVASVMLPRLCILTWFIRLHIFIYYRYKSFSKHLQIQNTACVGLWFSTNPARMRNLFL